MAFLGDVVDLRQLVDGVGVEQRDLMGGRVWKRRMTRVRMMRCCGHDGCGCMCEWGVYGSMQGGRKANRVIVNNVASARGDGDYNSNGSNGDGGGDDVGRGRGADTDKDEDEFSVLGFRVSRFLGSRVLPKP